MEPEKTLAGACLSALLTIDEFRRKGLERKRGLGGAGELKTAPTVAGHPASRA